MTTWTVPGVVLEVIDGDTVRLELDLGWRIYRRDPCRLVGINAPELHVAAVTAVSGAARFGASVGNPAGIAARDHLAGLLPIGQAVIFESHALDKYGRPLGVILLPNGGDVGAAMIRDGHAVRYDGGAR